MGRIIFTNGCFDMFHVGHWITLFYAESLKEHGDLLYVAINSDDSIRRIKGEDRPILPLSFRMKILQSIKFIDNVLPFNEDTPQELIKNLGLDTKDIIVKGSEYKEHEVVGWGTCAVYIVPESLTRDFDRLSTTEIVEKILKV